MLKIGVLKEIKNFENRVGLSPDGVDALIKAGLSVFVESNAGLISGFPDSQYIDVGAEIVPSAEKLLSKSNLLVKVLPLSPIEAEMVNDSHIVFSLLQLSSKGTKIDFLIESNTICFASDLIESENGGYPVLEALSEVSGRMAIHVASNLLCSTEGGKGILLSGAGMVPPANITILGAGLVGRVAAIQAWTNGANVDILTLKPRNIEKYNIVRNGLAIREYSKEILEKLLPKTDVLIVAAHSLKTNEIGFLVTKEMIEKMEPGSTIIDLSIAQNPVVETSHITSIDQPTFIVNNIVHYCVPNINSTVPRTSSKIYTDKTRSYIETLAKNGLRKAIEKSPELLSALVVYKGKVTNRIIADRLNYTFYNIFDLLELNL
jgi:alanine dehydrogenase